MTIRKFMAAGAAALALVAAGAVVSPAQAGHREPYKEEFDINIPIPNPAQTEDACYEDPIGEQNTFTHTFNPDEPGTLQVEANGFEGDWDIGVLDDKGKYIGAGDNASATPPTAVAPTEKARLRFDTPRNLVIRVCNFLGTATGHVKITYTYAN